MQRTNKRFYRNQIRGCVIIPRHTLFSFEEHSRKRSSPQSPKGKYTKKSIFRNERCSLVGIPGLEPGMTGPESVVLPLHHIPILLLRRIPEDEVGIPGLEPGMTGPESVVLPLHHIPISLQPQAYCFSIAGAKVQHFF